MSVSRWQNISWSAAYRLLHKNSLFAYSAGNAALWMLSSHVKYSTVTTWATGAESLNLSFFPFDSIPLSGSLSCYRFLFFAVFLFCLFVFCFPTWHNKLVRSSGVIIGSFVGHLINEVLVKPKLNLHLYCPNNVPLHLQRPNIQHQTQRFFMTLSHSQNGFWGRF